MARTCVRMRRPCPLRSKYSIRGSIRKDIIDIHKRKSGYFFGKSLDSESDVLKRIFPKYFASLDHCRRKGVITYAPLRYDQRMEDVWAIISPVHWEA